MELIHHGITSTKLDVKGVIPLHIEANGHHTRQVVYISNNIKGFYLSESALKDLVILDPSFPNQQSTSHANKVKYPTAPRGCHILRSIVPDLPRTIPFPPREEYREKLHAWILDHYAASAFKTCTHQPL